LISAGLVLLLALTWQSIRAARSNVEIVESVLNDYAELAAEQYALHLRQYFGYWWSYQLGLLITEQFEASSSRTGHVFDIGDEAPSPLKAASNALAAIFLLDTDSGTLSVLQGDLLVERSGLLRIIEEHPDRERFVVRHIETGSAGNVFSVLYPVPAKPYWYGVNFRPETVARRFRFVFENWPLLPEPLANNVEKNQGIRVQVATSSGMSIFDSGPASSANDSISASSAQIEMADDYQGLFSGFRLTASIDPKMADQLIIGGIPRSRLPVLVALMILTQIVLVAIFWVLYRERSVARMRSEFVARVSHEFRTPLTKIRMFAETLLMGRERSPEDRNRQLGIINREAKRLGHMVSNVLTLAGMEHKHFHIELGAQSLCNLLDRIIGEYSAMLTHSRTKIELIGCSEQSRAAQAMIDPESFTQVMTNLLDNACKYGPEGQTIRIELQVEEEKCRIMVEDEGPGIPEIEREKIWQLYYRLDREDEQGINGTGIGLPIALELLAAMNGDCRIETAPAGGARFIISLERPRE